MGASGIKRRRNMAGRMFQLRAKVGATVKSKNDARVQNEIKNDSMNHLKSWVFVRCVGKVKGFIVAE